MKRIKEDVRHCIPSVFSCFKGLVKKSCDIEHMPLCAFRSFTDPPADNAGDPLEERGLTDCSAISYPPFLKGDVTDR